MRFDALVMAGGKGKRLKSKIEKPILEFKGVPMVYRVVSALKESGAIRNIYAAVTDDTPETKKYLEDMEVVIIKTGGEGFVEDLVEALSKAGLGKTVVVSSDLPLLSHSGITEAVGIYEQSSKPNLSVYVPEKVLRDRGFTPTVSFNGLVPAGLNILDGRNLTSREYFVVLEKPELAANINTLKDMETSKNLYKTRD